MQSFYVEDPLDPVDNCARSVRKKPNKKIDGMQIIKTFVQSYG